VHTLAGYEGNASATPDECGVALLGLDDGMEKHVKNDSGTSVIEVGRTLLPYRKKRKNSHNREA
jgi:hypothetical protein